MYIYICEIYILNSLYSVHYIHLYHVYSIDPLFRCRFVANSLAMDFDSMDESLAKTLQSFVEVISQKDGKSEEDRFFVFSRSGFESLVRFDCMQPLIFVMMCFRFDIQETISCVLMCSCLCSVFILLHSGSRIDRKGRSWRWVKPGFLGDGKNDGSSDLCPLALNQSVDSHGEKQNNHVSIWLEWRQWIRFFDVFWTLLFQKVDKFEVRFSLVY